MRVLGGVPSDGAQSAGGRAHSCERNGLPAREGRSGSRVSWIHSSDSPRREHHVLCVDVLVCDSAVRTGGFSEVAWDRRRQGTGQLRRFSFPTRTTEPETAAESGF